MSSKGDKQKKTDEVTPEALIKKSNQLQKLIYWLKISHPDFSADMVMHKRSSGKTEYRLEVFQNCKFLNNIQILRFKYEGSDPDSVAKTALDDLCLIDKEDKKRFYDPYSVIRKYVSSNYRVIEEKYGRNRDDGKKKVSVGLETYEQGSAPNTPEDARSVKKDFNLIVGTKSMHTNDFIYVLAYCNGLNYQQAADQVLAEVKFKEMNNLLWVDDLESVNLMDKEELRKAAAELYVPMLPKSISPPPPPSEIKTPKSLQDIVTKKAKEVGKTFYLSAFLMTLDKPKAGEASKPESSKNSGGPLDEKAGSSSKQTSTSSQPSRDKKAPSRPKQSRSKGSNGSVHKLPTLKE